MSSNKGLVSLDQMFGKSVKEDLDTYELDIELLIPFSKHMFKLYAGERKNAMIESIREFGIIEPIVVRKLEDKYEILAGHNRWYAAKETGLRSVPVVILNISDEEAQLIVTESNLIQRSFSDLSISEKASILDEHYKALMRQGKRKDLVNEINREVEERDNSTCGQIFHKLKSREEMQEEYGLTGRDISRYIRINKLINQLKVLVDEKMIPFISGVDLSFISIENQKFVLKEIQENGYKMDLKKSERLKVLEQEGTLNEHSIKAVLAGLLEKKIKIPIKIGVKLKPKLLQEYFTENDTEQAVEKTIKEALELYFTKD